MKLAAESMNKRQLAAAENRRQCIEINNGGESVGSAENGE
jgi:hypothetical protein